MKISKKYLQQIIKEELQKALQEQIMGGTEGDIESVQRYHELAERVIVMLGELGKAYGDAHPQDGGGNYTFGPYLGMAQDIRKMIAPA